MLALLVLAGVAASSAAADASLVLEQPAEVVATVTAGCGGCDWGRRGHEAAALELRVDGRYSQHLLLTRGELTAPYRVALGRLDPGPHRVTVAVDARHSARETREARIVGLELSSFDPQTAEGRLLAEAPILEARPNSVDRFTDVPLVMWAETDAMRDGGTRLRYSVVFSNEDGGTPADRLMATWGRLTDIEYVLGVRLDGSGRPIGAEYQGPRHRLKAFAGRREAGHPILYVKTDNNMVADRGRNTLRFRPAPAAFELGARSREAVMDEAPWTYAVSVAEARREGRVDEQARPGSGKVPDPRRFATIEACAATEDATIAFSVGVHGDGGLRWFDSDAGLPEFRIRRRATEFPNGCFRGAVAIPAGTRAEEIVALRFRAFTRIADKGEPALPPGSGKASLKSVNRLFLFDASDQPGPDLFSWQGALDLPVGSAPVELPITAGRSSACVGGPARCLGSATAISRESRSRASGSRAGATHGGRVRRR